ncbi:AraC family transcriptional regulator [Frankia sp. CNm7]|uniref:AraC family transcriptional regulator n=1 Tax=Frankia nepalensis TaxID=1836974 RepID=A0A937RNK1_9ACTN|nr:AraC family transcriptional regulator [Frankia nepalensis]MBL7511957.1 AraC family transcriptional regulator [Frankia nepalensis]MBL7524053.1 AraC family transcriptional regulator [Frankia nepalensis]MBL7630549.1 AraC family transcriptional regulator [Frankia nepalensis]
MDILSDMLAVSGVRGVLGARIEAGDDWGWWAAPSAGAAFHAVTAGTAWLARFGEPPRQLLPGDVLLLPRGAAHALGSDPAAVARAAAGRPDGYEQAGPGTVRIGAGPVRTHVLCAHYEHDPVASSQPFALLPAVVHIDGRAGGPGLEATVRLLGHELAQAEQVATSVVLDRLVDILLVQLLRAWLAGEPPGARPSVFGALRDPLVGAAVAALHRDPARAWTTEALAREIAVSRATLTRRFRTVTGDTPGAYLTRWRLDLAARRLRDGDDSLETIAHSVGYTSVYAFSRAFSRARATPPGRYRAEARRAGIDEA